MALHFYTFSTWRAKPGIYLEDLIVREEHRSKGYGKALLRELAARVVAMDGARLEWSVLKWNEPSIRFYEAMGAKPQNHRFDMRVDRDDLVRLANRP